MSEASRIEIVRRTTGEVVSADLLTGLTPPDLLVIEPEWGPHRSRQMQSLLSAGVPRREWPESLHWDWRSKSQELKLLASAGFGIVFEQSWQGVMLTKTAPYSSRLDKDYGKPVVYIDYLEIAPWNWSISTLCQQGQFKGVGSVLLWRAVKQSEEEGFHGRIGLHALPQAEPFYKRIRMTAIGRDSDKQNLLYFELSRDEAARLLTEGGIK